MQPFRSQSTVEQLADHLREEIRRGGLGDTAPGVSKLVRQLGVGTETVIAALGMLEREGLLVSQGPRRPKKIVRTRSGVPSPTLRVGLLLYEETDAHDDYMVEMRHCLQEMGHTAEFSSKTLIDLGMDAKRVARFVSKNDVDAWVVRAGSKPILDWFAQQSVPAFAMFGRQDHHPIAGVATLKSPAVAEALQRLAALGHRRIVLMTREERRKPHPGLLERRILGELETLGIEVGPYNLPDWEDTREGFHRCLAALFKYSPPTTLIIDNPALFFAAQQFLNQRGLAVPRDVSMLALDQHSAFDWFQPSVAHIRTDLSQSIRRVCSWIDNVACGKDDRGETLIKARFVEGGTIGPAPGKES